MYTVPWKLASLSTVASKRKEAQGGISVSSQRTMPMSEPILRCSDHHLFHFGRGDRERDGEGGSFGSELRPHAFLLASMRSSGSFTSSSLSLTQWRARKRFQMLRKSKWNVLHHRRKFRSQTSDNMDRWKAEQGRGRKKRKIRRKKSRRERVRRKKMQMHEKVGKSRNIVFFQWFVAPGLRRVEK